MNKVMIIGNGGGGKTTLAHRIAERYDLPLTEIDALQFQPGWEPTAEQALRQAITAVHMTERWLIDGFGPWDQIEERARLSDTIIFVDHPIWVHFWWACERQIAAALGQQRLGGPAGCDLRDVTQRMFETIWRVHEQLRPNLVHLVDVHQATKTVVWIRSPEALDAFIATLTSNAPQEKAAIARAERNDMNTSIYNERTVDEELITAGQPTEAQLQVAAREGVRTVINLAPSDERSALPDEAGVVQALGMTYHHIPVDWQNPTEQDFAAFEQVMQTRAAGKTLLHCAANFRVSAFFSLYARKHLGWSAAQAAAFRASIWEGSNYVVWEAFIARLNACIDQAGAGEQVSSSS